MMALQKGDLAPNLTLPDQDDQAHALADFWHAQPTMLVFLRHFG